MMLFECGYAGADKDRIRLVADLDRGWSNLGNVWGFDQTNYLDYGDSRFRCRLRIVEKAPKVWETRTTFHERYLSGPLLLGNCSVSLHGMKLEVDVPLSQRWMPTNDSNRRPSVFGFSEDAFSIETKDGSIYYRLQVWLVLHGPSRMFVPDQREHGDGFAWIGGRPESNRRKF
jgi:hypothetical protein